MRRGALRAAALASPWAALALATGQILVVAPTVETFPVPSGDDAADDAAVWVHPADESLSLVIGTDKEGGLAVYEIDGTQRQFIGGMQPNNVDVRYGFPLGGGTVDIVAFGDRNDQTIKVFKVNPATRTLVNATADPIDIGIDVAYGFCLYRSWCSGEFYAFVNDEGGQVEQWRLFDDGAGHVAGSLVRSFDVGSQTEGMAADDELRWLYIGEEAEAVWKYGAEPSAGTQRIQIDSTDGAHLEADIEGLAIYHVRGGGGYLIVSSQGSSEYVAYTRQSPHAHAFTFQIGAGAGIDAVSGTDGIDVCNSPLGPLFPGGAFIAQDDENPGANQNFKLAPWDAIPGVEVDTGRDPRFVPEPGDLDGNGAVGLTDMLMMLPAWGSCAPPLAAPCPADLNCDGTVGLTDLLSMLSSWTVPPLLPHSKP